MTAEQNTGPASDGGQQQMSLEELETHIRRAEAQHRDLSQRLDATARD